MKTTENKKHFKLIYRGFEITNTWNSDGYVALTEDPKYFLTKVSHTVGQRHCGCHHTEEDAKATIDKIIEETIPQNRGLNNGQVKCIEMNKGKIVNIATPVGDVLEAYIHDATMFQTEFRYIMHKAKNPRKPFIHNDDYALANAEAGYFYVHPMRIILE